MRHDVAINLLTQSLAGCGFRHAPLVVYVARSTPPYEVEFISGDLDGILGWNADHVTGQPSFWRDHIHPDDWPGIEDAVVKLQLGEHIRFNYRFCHRDGSYRWLQDEATLVAVNSEDPPLLVGFCMDKTLHHEGEGLRQALLHGVAEGVCVCHRIEEYPHVTFTIWNQRMIEITGYTMEEINRLGWYQTVYTDPATRQRAMERMDRMRLGDNLVAEEWTITRKDGQSRTLLISTGLIDGDDGSPNVLALMLDITARKQIEETLHQLASDLERRVRIRTDELNKTNRALREINDRLAATLDALPDQLFEVDREGRIHDYRTPSREKLYVSPEKFVGRNVRDVLPTDAVRVITAAIEEAWRLGHHRGGIYSLDFPAGRRWYELSISRKGDSMSSSGRLMVLVRDFTAHRIAQESLLANEQRFRALVEKGAGGITIVDARGVVLYDAPSQTLEVGYTPEEMMGRNVLDLVEPLSRRVAETELTNLANQPGKSVTLDLPVIAKDGSRHIMQVVATNLMHDPAVGGIVLNTRDITEQMRYTETIRQLTQRLLQIQDHERRVFSRELHETTNQNLAALTMWLTKLKQHAEHCPPEAKAALDAGMSLAQQCSEEVRTMTYLLHPPLLEERGLTSALQWLVEDAMGRSTMPIELRVEWQDGRLPGLMETALFRVAQEGLANILRHSRATAARLLLRRESNCVLLEIKDNGSGMQSKSRASWGVGLLGVQERVDAFNGTMEIDGDLDGTCLRVRLPVLEEKR